MFHWLEWSVDAELGPHLRRHPEHREQIESALASLAADPYAVGGMREEGSGVFDGRAYVLDVTDDLDLVFGMIPELRQLVLWRIRYWPDLADQG